LRTARRESRSAGRSAPVDDLADPVDRHPESDPDPDRVQASGAQASPPDVLPPGAEIVTRIRESSRCSVKERNSDRMPDFFLSPSHLAALLATATAGVALPVGARAHPGRWTRVVSRGLSVLLIGAFLALPLVLGPRGEYELDSDLPLHLTDAVTVVAAVALWSPRPLPFELTYFWGLTASALAVVTPALGADEGISSFLYWHYFVTHSGVVVAAVFLAFGIGLTARPGAVWRIFVATTAWAAVAAVGNAITGGNYMFLSERPETPSLLDYMGPWPSYILGSALLALALFTLLDLPFRRRRADGSRIGPSR
jgi:hypothetical integral membrane protein (TIGR02206 family)